MEHKKRWINPDEFQEEFGIKKNTQSQMRKKRKIPFSKIGGFVYYDRDLIDIWLENHTVEEVA